MGPRTLVEMTLQGGARGPVVARFRRANERDLPAVEHLIARSARELSAGDYSGEQVEAALGSALGVDSQLIRDGTYFVAEVGDEVVACGGWSWRRTLFGADGGGDREPEALDPARDSARIRAFFVHPRFARLGLGRATLALCEAEARGRGFRSAELMATLPGERLYRSCGYVAEGSLDHPLPGGLTIRFVPMRKRLEVAVEAPLGWTDPPAGRGSVRAMPVEVLGFDHVYLAVRDLGASEAFYDRALAVFGFRKLREPLAGEPHVHYYGPQFGFTLRLARPGTPDHDPYAPGLHHLCLRVGDEAAVDRAARELRAAGITASPAQHYPEYAPDYYATFFSDLDGVRLEVCNFWEARRRRMEHWDAGDTPG